MPKRPISYTSRDFDSIKNSLVNYAKRYYANTYQDFNEASFGAMMLDLVSYVGDQLSFYTDYQANESFLDSALEIDNISRIAKQMGYKQQGAPASTGVCNFYVLVPAASTTSGPDADYIPILKRGALVTSAAGGVFTLIEDVDFSKSSNEITVGRVDSDTGVPTYFAIKGQGIVVSGRLSEEELEVDNYQRFLRLELQAENITEVLSVTDSQGNEYFQVDFLTQDIVLSKEPNRGSNKDTVPFIMKTKPVPRRFVTEFDSAGRAYLQFGYGSSENITGDLIADPADVVLDVTGRKYITDTTFDPANLIKTDKFGVVPENTTLTVRYRENTSNTISAAASAIDTVILSDLAFENRLSLSSDKLTIVESSMEAENPEPILGSTAPITATELKARAYGSFASQNRAVTKEDYISLAYRMPTGFGRIKRANIIQDSRSARRNLNMYILADDTSGNLTTAPAKLKDNLRVWLNRYRMINDTVDILDGKIINYGIEFEVIADLGANKFEVLQACVQKLTNKVLNVRKEMGEPVYITDIFKHLNDVPGVIDTTSVRLINKTGGSYSNFNYDMVENLSADGRFLEVPQDTLAELLFTTQDIQGVVK